jgi:hypothetical protein
VEVNKQIITKAAMNAFYRKVNKGKSLQHRKISYITLLCKVLCNNMLIQQTAKLGCSGQKGAIENANKMLREYFPKGTDFKTCHSRTTQ